MPNVLINDARTGYTVGSTQLVTDATANAWIGNRLALLADTVAPDPLSAQEQQSAPATNLSAAEVALTRSLVSGAGNSALAAGVVASLTTGVRTLGGTLSATESTALTTFVTAAMAGGYWAKLIEAMPFVGGFAGAPVKLKYTSVPACALVGMSAGDYGAAGLTGDGSAKWINTRLTHNDVFGLGLGGLAVYITGGNPTAANSCLMGSTIGGGPQTFIRYQGSTVRVIDCVIGNGGALAASPSGPMVALAPGMYHAERGSLSLMTLYLGGAPAGTLTSTITASGNSDYPIGILAQGQNGAFQMAASVGFAAVTDGTMTAEEALLFSTHVNQLMYALGRTGNSTRRVRYVPIIGQSNARGGVATPAATVTQPYQNRMVATGQIGNNPTLRRPLVWTSAMPGLLTPLVEASFETIASAALNTVSQKARAAGLGETWDTVALNWAVGATAYSGMSKDTQPYQNNLAALRYVASAAAAQTSGAVDVPFLLSVHGESDSANLSYAANVLQWQADYSADFAALTERAAIPIFHSQISCWTSTGNLNAATTAAADQLLIAHETDRTRAVLVCPRYFLTHGTTSDGVHIANAAAMAKLGEYYGKAVYQHIVQGIQWEPLRPGTISRVGATVTVQMIGCVGNLVLDTTSVTDPGSYGFEWAGGSSISSVSVSGSTVTITLSAAQAGTLRYAWTGTVGAAAGPTTGPRGCLRDSDTTTGYSGVALPNWCVHFSKAVA